MLKFINFNLEPIINLHDTLGIVQLRPLSIVYLVKLWMRAPWIPIFLQFHAVWQNFWQNRMLVPPPQGSASHLGGILDNGD